MQLLAQKHMVEDDTLFTNHLAGKWEIPVLVLTSASYLGSNQLKLVLTSYWHAWQKGIVWLVTLPLVQTLAKEVV